MPNYEDVNDRWISACRLYERKFNDYEKIVYERSIKK